MSEEKSVYRISQVVGWFGFVFLIFLQNLVDGHLDWGIWKVLVVNFILGIGLSHGMRAVIIRTGMIGLKLYRLVPRIVLLSIVTGVVAALLYGTISDLFFTDVRPILVWPYTLLIELVVPFVTIFTFWNILYFAAMFLKNYEREEIKNLRLTASMNEAELNALRAQMNPHFMFNALNGIRALISENPGRAKKSITRLSNILRSSLTSVKKEFSTLEEELHIVLDYLELEKIRYEERLNYRVRIPDYLMHIRVPPLLLQTLVENAVKHGISTLPRGGEIDIIGEVEEESGVLLRVINSGKLKVNSEDAGVGFHISLRRLKLLYGDRARLELYPQGEKVVCAVFLPDVLKPDFKPNTILTYEDRNH